MFTCILVRSSAIVKSTGAWSDAATVCPTSTLREMTVPSMGEMMSVYERFVCAWWSCASVCATDAAATSTCAAVTCMFDSRVVDVLLRGQVLLEQRLLARDCFTARSACAFALLSAA